jgi:hypothetical protein
MFALFPFESRVKMRVNGCMGPLHDACILLCYYVRNGLYGGLRSNLHDKINLFHHFWSPSFGTCGFFMEREKLLPLDTTANDSSPKELFTAEPNQIYVSLSLRGCEDKRHQIVNLK